MCKTIRALLATDRITRRETLRLVQSITVPTPDNPYAVVRFSPKHHVICIQSSFGPLDGPGCCPTDLSRFSVRHVTFPTPQPSIQKALAIFASAFKCLTDIFGVVMDLPREKE